MDFLSCFVCESSLEEKKEKFSNFFFEKKTLGVVKLDLSHIILREVKKVLNVRAKQRLFYIYIYIYICPSFLSRTRAKQNRN